MTEVDAQCGTISLYPGTLPRSAPFKAISVPNDILDQMRLDWLLHLTHASRFIAHTTRDLAKYDGFTDRASIEDFFRTNRFDIGHHYNRSLSSEEPTSIDSSNQLLGAAGKRLVVLLDQYVSLLTATIVKAIEDKDLYTRQELRDKVPHKTLVNLNLICKVAEYKEYDPLPVLLANGQAIVSVLANVYSNQNRKTTLDPALFDREAFDFFNTETAQGIGASATAVWTAHLGRLVSLIGHEANYSLRARIKFPVKEKLTAAQVQELQLAVESLPQSSLGLANIFAYSVSRQIAGGCNLPFTA